MLANAYDTKMVSLSWLLRECVGRGRHILPDGSVFEGEWEAGERTRGRWQSADGAQEYSGQWKGHQRHGHGTQRIANVLSYIGDSGTPPAGHVRIMESTAGLCCNAQPAVWPSHPCRLPKGRTPLHIRTVDSVHDLSVSEDAKGQICRANASM